MIAVPKIKALLIPAFFIATLVTLVSPSYAQQVMTATTSVSASLRSGPSRNYPVVASVGAGTVLTVTARTDDSSWLLVQTKRGHRAWGEARQLQIAAGQLVADLPVSNEIIGSETSQSDPSVPATAVPDQPTSSSQAVGDLTSYAAKITPAVRAAMRHVYTQGQTLGNNPRVFAKVGDCLEGFIWFLFQYGDGSPYNLGPYQQLQEVINHFSVSPRAGVANPYVEQSQAAHSAFTSASVQDPEWSDPQVCNAGETPLDCEYRIDKPSVAIIMFGVVDVESLTAAQFDVSMRAIVKKTLAHGIIPIMSTAPENLAYGNKAAQFNRIVTQIANENKVPLTHLRDALYPLADHGLDHDGLHLTPGAGWSRVAFTPDQLQLGLPVWNLLALQSLDNVWRQIMY